MELQHFSVKFFVSGELTVELSDFIEMFHRWITDDAFDGLLLIDVADYRHVPAGPGVVLVGHQADFSLDLTDDRPGLRFLCKETREGANENRFRHAVASAAQACQLVESELPGVQFDRSNLQWAINDRAIAPNDEPTRQACQEIMQPILSAVLGSDDYQLQFQQDPRRLLGADTQLGTSLDLEKYAALSA